MIRLATKQDADRILEMSRKFYATTSYKDFAPMNDATVADLIQNLTDNHIMLVAEIDGQVVGMAGMMMAPFYFNANKRGAYEVVWWVEPEHQAGGIGKRLLESIIEHSKLRECDIVQMVTLATSPEHAGKIYEKYEFNHSETSYTRIL